MALRALCPWCGIPFNTRESSIGTMKKCSACSQKFILTERHLIREKQAGCFAQAWKTLMMIVLGVVIALLCLAGLSIWLANKH